MRVSMNWLKDYINVDDRPETIADKISMSGIAVERVEYLGQNISQVVTGIVTEVKKHPNANKLFIIKVDNGEETLTIVTGADNVRQYDIVPVALVGAKLPNGIEIKETQLRGVTSRGMLCSAVELELDKKVLAPGSREGILILPSDTPVGTDIREALGLNDVIFEIELTPNRADCYSVLGVAREIAAVYGKVATKPILHVRENAGTKAAAMVNISVSDTALCPRFAVRVLTGLKVGSSPAWLVHKLQSAGVRPINNIVDVTNFVMLEMGQPLHAYDYNLISRHTLTVRKAQQGERLTTLDGIKRELQCDMLVIADATQAVGIAGVMGGLATEITQVTQNVILEAAAFDSISIRRTAKALGLRTEASARFERGVDAAIIVRALDRAAKLLEDMGVCKVCPEIVDIYPNLALPSQVMFTPEQINKYLGTNISRQQMAEILRRLEFETDINGDKIFATIPTWRSDISAMPDIAEEIARVYGYGNIPVKTPNSLVSLRTQKYETSVSDYIRQIMSTVGFDEILTMSFTSPAVLDKLNIASDSFLCKAIPILNPITEEFPLLRTTLLGGLMETIVRNLAHKNEDLRIFELGSVFIPDRLPMDALPEERAMLCGAMIGKRFDDAWNQPCEQVDFYDVKGVVENILSELGITDYQVSAGDTHALHSGKTAIFNVFADRLAAVGEVHPKVLEAFGVNRKVYLFEMPVAQLVKHAKLDSKYQQLPRFPAIVRDLAVVLPINITADQVSKVISSIGQPLLKDVSLFDVYTGGQIKRDARSLAFTMTFRAFDRTLTDEEVDEIYKKIVISLKNTFCAKLRI